MTATQIADAFELAVRTRDVASVRHLLHPRIQVSAPLQMSYRGVEEVMTWGASILGDSRARITVVERYIDEPLAVLVVLWTKDHTPGTEYTVALTTLDDALIRIVVDA